MTILMAKVQKRAKKNEKSQTGAKIWLFFGSFRIFYPGYSDPSKIDEF
jgi:hypothetical protein